MKLSKFEILFLVIIFLVSLVVRWYNIPHNLFFGFEQGRDASIIQNIYQKHEFKLVGPQTDLPGIFHGAYYYYLLLIPSILSHGNPLVLSFTLIFISCFLPVIFYFFGKSVFESEYWAAVCAIFAAMSYEYIIYSRWLSNVTPGIPLILLTYYFLWLYRKKNKDLFFILSCVCAAFAAQFEVVLVLLFGFMYAVMLLTRVIPFPKWKTLVLAVMLSAALFTPHLIFNLRNQNIIFSSITSFATQKSDHQADFMSNWHHFVESYQVIFRKSLSLPDLPFAIPIGAIILTVLLVSVLITQKTFKRKDLLFFVVWFLMAVPVLFFHDVARLTQLYLAIGMSYIFFFVIALRFLWQTLPGKIIAGILVLMIVLFGWTHVAYDLQGNHDVFFITVQEGMNYHDQIDLLKFIHADANGQTYRLEAFTIPYLHLDGWEYLQQYLYPGVSNRGSKLVYVVIEKQVEAFWQKKWTEDLGESQLISENTFGQLRVQKRILK